MKAVICLLPLALCFVACNQQRPEQISQPPIQASIPSNGEELYADADSIEYNIDDNQVEFYKATKGELEGSPALHKSVIVTLHSISYGTRDAFGRAGVDKFRRVINSKVFKTAVLKTKFEDDQGLTPKQIYEKIIGAKESYANDRDGVIDLRMRLITLEDGTEINKKCNRIKDPVVGRDGGKTGVMNTCPNWVERRVAKKDTAAMARHIAHEYMHRFGFKHPGVNLKSVPYKIGGIVQDLAKKLR
jgi:hypothetical protein